MSVREDTARAEAWLEKECAHNHRLPMPPHINVKCPTGVRHALAMVAEDARKAERERIKAICEKDGCYYELGHVHVADHTDENFRRCAKCGHDLTDPVHTRQEAR